MSYGYWMDKHTKHHANPNHDDLDPDVGPGVLVWSPEAATGRTGFAGWLTRNQAWLFLPVWTLLGLSRRRDSIRGGRAGTVKHRRAEAILLTVHLAGYFSLL